MHQAQQKVAHLNAAHRGVKQAGVTAAALPPPVNAGSR